MLTKALGYYDLSQNGDFLSKHPSQLAIVSDLELAVQEQDLVVLVGHYNSGKTAIVRQAFPNSPYLDGTIFRRSIANLQRLLEDESLESIPIVIDETYAIQEEFGGLKGLIRSTRKKGNPLVLTYHPSALLSKKEELDILKEAEAIFVYKPLLEDELVEDMCLSQFGTTTEEAKDISRLVHGDPNYLRFIKVPGPFTSSQKLSESSPEEIENISRFYLSLPLILKDINLWARRLGINSKEGLSRGTRLLQEINTGELSRDSQFFRLMQNVRFLKENGNRYTLRNPYLSEALTQYFKSRKFKLSTEFINKMQENMQNSTVQFY